MKHSEEIWHKHRKVKIYCRVASRQASADLVITSCHHIHHRYLRILPFGRRLQRRNHHHNHLRGHHHCIRDHNHRHCTHCCCSHHFHNLRHHRSHLQRHHRSWICHNHHIHHLWSRHPM